MVARSINNRHSQLLVLRQNGREIWEEIMSHEVRKSIVCVISVTDLLDAAYEEQQNSQEILLKKEYVDIIIRNTKGLKKQSILSQGLMRHNLVIGVVSKVNKIW